MNGADKNYLRTQYWLKIHQKNAAEFQVFFEEIMDKAFTGFQKIRPYGKQGDGGNDGYRPDAGIYYQVYAPKDPQEKDAAAAKKLKADFEKLMANWNEISKVKTFYFVFNDKGAGTSIEIERALAELRSANQSIEFEKFTPKDLEEIFFSLKTDQILSLGFDVDSTKAVRFAYDTLSALEVDLDRGNCKFLLRSLQSLRDTTSELNDENLLLEYEILECRILRAIEKTKEARQKYEDICLRYPKNPRPFLYLAEIHLNDGNCKKNEELLEKAQRIESTHWLLKLERLISEYQSETQIDVASIHEEEFPTDPKIKSKFYQVCSLILEKNGDQERADTFIQRAISLNPDSINNHYVKLVLSNNKMFKLFSQDADEEKLKKNASDLLIEIDVAQKQIENWGEVSLRNQARLDFLRVNAFFAQNNFYEIENMAKQSFELLIQCYFDRPIENLLISFLTLIEIPPKDFVRLLQYIKKAEKAISDDLAKMIFIQFIFEKTLFTEGKRFFVDIDKKSILNFIHSLENKQYDEAWIFLKEDPQFAVVIANTAKQFPELRRKIIENLPNDGSVQKEKLLLLLKYDEKNTNEAFELLKDFDLLKSNYSECRLILKIAQEKKAWDFVIPIVEKLLLFEKGKQIILQLKQLLFIANLNLGKFSEACIIGEELLSNSAEVLLSVNIDREILLGNTIYAKLKRGEHAGAKMLLEKYSNFPVSFKFKVEIEAEVYLRNNDANKALSSVVEGIKLLKTPTPEQYGSLFPILGEIGNMLNFHLTSEESIKADCFVKFEGQERWFFVGDTGELDATKIPLNDIKASKFLGKKTREKVIFENKYGSNTVEYMVENILTTEKYIAWQSSHQAQRLTREHRWDRMELIEVPKVGDTIDTKYIIARLEDDRKKRSEFFDLYCSAEVPLAFLAVNHGGLAHAIAFIRNENKGFVKCSTGEPTEINQQKDVAKRIISGDPFYIDATSALVLSETGLLIKFYNYLPNLRVPQSVITFLLNLREKFSYRPGQAGNMGYAQGKLIFSPIDVDGMAAVQRNFDNCVRLLESKPQNISVISIANKTDCEKKIPAELCDACILAQKSSIPVLTEDFLYLKANELETAKKAPEYCSTFALARVLYEQKKITFEQYLNFFTYLSSYRFRFLTLNTEDIEKAVFGDGVIKAVQPEKIRQFNFPLTLSKGYGVPFDCAFVVVGGFLSKVIIDNSIMPEMAERIFAEILFAFPTDMDKSVLGKMFIRVCVQIIYKINQKITIVGRVQEKIDLLSKLAEIYNAGNIWRPQVTILS